MSELHQVDFDSYILVTILMKSQVHGTVRGRVDGNDRRSISEMPRAATPPHFCAYRQTTGPFMSP